MKQFPADIENLTIGRIQERLASGTRPHPAPKPFDTATGTRETHSQSNWLIGNIRETTRRFMSLASRGRLRSELTFHGSESGNIRRFHALLLAYKLTMTVWRRRQERADPGVLEELRTRMIAELHESGVPESDDGPSDFRRPRFRQDGPLTSRLNFRSRSVGRAYLDPADSDIAAAMIRFEAGLPGPLTPFYGSLAPVFGGHCPTHNLAGRYGKIVRHLYDNVEKSLDEKERVRAQAATKTHYATAGR